MSKRTPAPAPAELLRGLRPIPTYRDHPATVGHDVIGTDPNGAQREVSVVASLQPVLLLFLSSGCLGCRDFWEGAGQIAEALKGHEVRVVIVTRDPEDEDPAAIAALAAAATGIDVVMSSRAYRDYGVAGPPFYALTVGSEVRTEGVAWGIGETAEAVSNALQSPKHP